MGQVLVRESCDNDKCSDSSTDRWESGSFHRDFILVTSDKPSVVRLSKVCVTRCLVSFSLVPGPGPESIFSVSTASAYRHCLQSHQ